ncbi:MAG TPA: glycosyltransferase family 4 protein [Candidatus Aminicenantes bacterium]|nr:glycosyltransferase family 4 protein [Candidatus Aminicenantes bacterium]
MYGSDAIVLLGIQGFPALLTAALARLKRKPLIVVSQTMGPLPEMNRPLFLRRLKALVLKAASQHIAQTPKTVETLKAVYQVKDENITVIAYDGGAKQFHRVISNMDRGARLQVRAALAFPSGARIILYCGTLINLKGVDVLIKAMAQLRSADPKCFLLIAGRDGDRYGSLTSLRCLADSLGLASGVRFLGDLPWEELARIYVAADVFVLPTRKDTWGKVLVEAGLAGLPLVTTQVCGGAGSLVQDGVNGYVVPVDDVGALGEALLKLTDPLRRRAFGNASRAIMADYLREINEEVLFRVVLERCLGAGT